VAYILGLILTSLFFLALHYFTELNKKEKFIVSAILLSIISAAISYNTYSSTQREKMMSVVTEFKQGKTIRCKNKDVNSSLYTLSIGTFTFIGKKDTPNYAEMISVAECN
jgi:glucan phosphoethanolaminetransferase (alkaline phosphatase superfamily)